MDSVVKCAVGSYSKHFSSSPAMFKVVMKAISFIKTHLRFGDDELKSRLPINRRRSTTTDIGPTCNMQCPLAGRPVMFIRIKKGVADAFKNGPLQKSIFQRGLFMAHIDGSSDRANAACWSWWSLVGGLEDTWLLCLWHLRQMQRSVHPLPGLWK